MNIEYGLVPRRDALEPYAAPADPGPGAHPVVSIVILAWNRKNEVERTICEIAKSAFRDFEIVLVDNASTDGTADLVRRIFPDVRLVRLPENRGIYGYNVGFANARGDYIVVLDDDSHPAPDALGRMVQLFRADTARRLGAVAFRIVRSATGEVVTSDWPDGEWITFWGCGAGFRREALVSCGGYDADFFIYANEYDLSIRMLDAGWSIIHRPDIVSFHRECSTHRSWKRTGWIGARNEAWFHLKHFPWWSLAPLAAVTLSRYAAKGIRKRSAAYAWYSIAGFVRGYATAGSVLGKRKAVRGEVARLFFRHHWLLAPAARAASRLRWRASRRSARRTPSTPRTS